MAVNFSNWVKLEQMKGLVLKHLTEMGLKEQVRTMSDIEVDQLVYMMALLGDELRTKDTEAERVEMLVSYIICLWSRLIVDYGADINDF